LRAVIASLCIEDVIILLAANRSFPESTFFPNPVVQPCIERRKLGTGMAIKRATTLINAEQVYVMNVDDIVFYNPKKLFEYSTIGVAVLLAQPQLPFGKNYFARRHYRNVRA